MSAAAEAYAQAYAHPELTANARILFTTIAKHVPDGQTTTGPLVLEDLAREARQSVRTVRRSRDLLVRLGELRGLDRGRGSVARYELVAVEGVRPVTARPLPLIGATPAKAQRKTSVTLADLPNLFDEARSDAIGQVDRSFRNLWKKIGQFGRSLTAIGWARTKRWRKRSVTLADLAKTDRKTSVTLTDLPAPLSRSRSVEEEDARARETATFLAWWSTSFPSARLGPTGTVVRTRHGTLIRDLLEQGYAPAELRRLALELWQVESDRRPNSDRDWIARSDRSLVVLHRKAAFLRSLLDPDGTPRPDAASADAAIWDEVLARLETRVNRHSFYTWFRDTVLLADHGDWIEVARRGPMSADAAAWLSRHFTEIVATAIAEIRPHTRVVFVALDDQQRKSG